MLFSPRPFPGHSPSRGLSRQLMVAVVLASAAFDPSPLGAQTCSSNPNIWQFIRQCGDTLTAGDPVELTAALEEAYRALRAPSTLNSALGRAEGVVPGGVLFQALDLHFVNVQEGDEQELGVRYSWSKSIIRTPHAQGTTHWGYDLHASSKGLITAEAEDNPEELLETLAYPHFFWSWGGAADSATVAEHLGVIQDSIFAYQAFDRDATSDLSGLMAQLWDGLSTEVYLTMGPEGRFESDQTWARRQWAVGGKVGIDIKAWDGDSGLAKLNIFDWPAALLRYFSGLDDRIRPSGSAIPTLLLSAHRVSTKAHPEREALEGLAPYSRWGVEINYRSLSAQVVGGPLWLEVSYRHHEEIDPSQAVRDAQLHSYDRLLIGLLGPGGLGAWWARGRLPLDRQNTDHFGLGFRVRF